VALGYFLYQILSLRQDNSSLSSEIKETKESYQRTLSFNQQQLQTEKEKISELESEIRRLTTIINPQPKLPDTTDNLREDLMVGFIPVPGSPQKDMREDEVSDIENIPKPQHRRFLDSSTETVRSESFRSKKSKSPKKKKKRSKTPEKPPKTKSSPKTSIKKRKITKKSTAPVSKKTSKNSPKSSKSNKKSPYKKKHREYDTVSEARRFLASFNTDSFIVSSYNLRPRKYRFVDKSTRSPYKIANPISTSELSRTDPFYSRHINNPTNSLKRKRLEF